MDWRQMTPQSMHGECWRGARSKSSEFFYSAPFGVHDATQHGFHGPNAARTNFHAIFVSNANAGSEHAASKIDVRSD